MRVIISFRNYLRTELLAGQMIQCAVISIITSQITGNIRRTASPLKSRAPSLWRGFIKESTSIFFFYMTEIVSWQGTTWPQNCGSNRDERRTPGSYRCEFMWIGEEICCWQIIGENRSGRLPELCQKKKRQAHWHQTAHTQSHPNSWLRWYGTSFATVVRLLLGSTYLWVELW